MKSRLWALICLSLVWFGSIVNGAAVLNNPSIPHLTNSSLRIDIPAEFKITLEGTPRGPQVRVMPCFNLAIKIVGEHLALEDFSEEIDGQGWSMSQVVISVSTKWIPGYKIERRFVVWGIYEALILFEDQKDFRSAIFTLAWRGKLVGYLAIYPEGLASIDDSFNSPALVQMEPPLSIGSSNNSVSSNSSSLDDQGLELSFGFLEPVLPLDLDSTLLAILGALCDAAQWPKNKVVPGRYLIRAGSARTQIDVRPEKILNYKWLIKALTLIPWHLMFLRNLYAFRVEIRLGTLNLGLMNVIPRGPISHAPSASIEAGFNMSVDSATARER